MDFNTMTVEEIIVYFCNKSDNGEMFSLSELRRAAKSCDVIDHIANPDAVTMFYSGGENAIAKALASSGGKNVRILDC